MSGKTNSKWVIEIRKDWTERESGWKERRTGEITTHQSICWRSQRRVEEQGRKAPMGTQEKRILKILDEEWERRRETIEIQEGKEKK